MSSSFLRHYIDDSVGTIILNRPESKNAITADMWRSFPDILDIMSRHGVEIVVIRGAGGTFAAGADLTELQQLRTYEQAEENWNAISSALGSIAESNLVSVAAIDGPCIGGGCLLAVACDLRYASANSVFGVPIARLGIILDDANVARITSLVGLANAKDLLLRGNIFSAETALRKGLINNVAADAKELGDMVAGVVAELQGNSASSMVAAKKSTERVCGLNSFPSMEDPTAIVESYLSSDFKSRVSKALGQNS